jgi:tRNA(fMet)-specific endonuclease VapC
MNYLIDTDYVADYLKGYQTATAVLTQLFPEGIGISIITFAEIYEGIFYGQNRQAHEQGFRQFIRNAHLLGLTNLVAKHFARIRGDLRGKGLLIPDPDLYIAATALHHNLTLVTRNRRDFERIPHLKLYQTA